MSRTGIIGDVHANLPALETVLSAADCASWICIGDIVGYGPFPNECVDRIAGTAALSVAGNHDLGSLGALDLAVFNRDARMACEWTREVLEEEPRKYLESLDAVQAVGDRLVVHASPRDPVWEYVSTKSQALDNFLEFGQRLCFHGHSHVPLVFVKGTGMPDDAEDVEAVVPREGREIELEDGRRYLVNVGSVGQPRDGDPRSCYVILDEDRGTLSFHRAAYDVALVQERMAEVGLPPFLIDRLAIGR